MGWLKPYLQPYCDKAMEEGKAEGEARALTRFLEKRFGRVPDAIREQIYTADTAAIEAWVERAVDAPTLQSVFQTN